MRQTIQDAEQDEPLLAEKLVRRRAHRPGPEPGAGSGSRRARLCGRASCKTPSSKSNQPAAASANCAQRVDQAAEAVLGDETEALRRAREELQGLSNELNQEINRNSPNARQPGQNSRVSVSRAKTKRASRSRASSNPATRTKRQRLQGRKRQGKGRWRKASRRAARTGRQKAGGQKGGKRQARKGKAAAAKAARAARSGSRGEKQDGQPQDGQPASDKPVSGRQGQRNGARRLGGDNTQERGGYEGRLGKCRCSRRSPAKTSATGPTACGMWKKWSPTLSCGPRPPAFVSGPAPCAPISSAIRDAQLGAGPVAGRRPARRAARRGGDRASCAARPSRPSFRSTEIRFRPSTPRRRDSTTSASAADRPKMDAQRSGK